METDEATHKKEIKEALRWECVVAPANPYMEHDPKHPMAHWYVTIDGLRELNAMTFHYSMGYGLCEQWLKSSKARAWYKMQVRNNGPMTAAELVKLAQQRGMKPSDDDIALSLCNIALDANPLFDEWCDDFGYDDDSIKARDTWQACLRQEQDLRRVFPQSVEWWADAREEIDV